MATQSSNCFGYRTWRCQDEAKHCFPGSCLKEATGERRYGRPCSPARQSGVFRGILICSRLCVRITEALMLPAKPHSSKVASASVVPKGRHFRIWFGIEGVL
jgi:hypothetical protein